MAAISSKWQCDVCSIIVTISGSQRPRGWDDAATISYKRHVGQGYFTEIVQKFTVCDQCNGPKPEEPIGINDQTPVWIDIIRRIWWSAPKQS